ncbi:hypothetical protein [Lentzea cavernae]|uniref:Uncharacterized protein n=1 Tax=Lentzea cavernae TaxID=2020703 RepID=A0ABQ3MQG8_9PSEU|nr:hypothetical protein [Lentzea cavernae]GHH56005.1 hypothetical protein GCM10017774_73320 [Lentzea cavernae]
MFGGNAAPQGRDIGGMSWFSRKPRSRFPSDMAQRLEMLGRFEFDVHNSGVDSADIFPYCLEPFWPIAQEDPIGLLADLREFVKDDDSGFVTYGASRLARELVDKEHLSTPDALALLDGAIEFKRMRNLPSAMLTGHEWSRWLDVHGQGTWPHGRTHPPV